MPSNHARLSASGAYRWSNCPGSIHLSEQCPEPSASTYADEGTTAHALAEIKLRKIIGDISDKSYESNMERLKGSEYYCGEMEEATEFYKDEVLEAYAEAGEDAVLLIEQRLDLSEWVPESFGTSDAVVIGNDVIQVIDLKYGKGVKVNAENNPQLRLYGLGAAHLFADLYDFSKVKTTIIQPRLDWVSSELKELKELDEWAETVIRPAAEKAMNNVEEYAAGEWCRFCPAKAVCRERANKNLEIAKYDFAEPALLSNDEIAEILGKADNFTRWISDIEDYALERALAGEKFTGWKVVEGRSNRKYADDIKVAKALIKAGFEEAALYERKLYGITAMEKLVGKKKFEEILKDLIIKPQGKPVLVTEDDKREELNTAAKAAEDFKEDI